LHHLRLQVSCIALLVVVVACATSTPAAKNQRDDLKDLFDFLSRGQLLTKQEVMSYISAPPSATFEHERVLTYRLGRLNDGGYFVYSKKGWDGVDFDLVLVFDDQGVLQRHSVVTIHKP
jgi:hypothetical protein